MKYALLLLTLLCFSFIDKPKCHKPTFVTLQGKKQYYLSKGNGAPVIVLVSGLGPTMDDFSVIQNALSKTYRTICYDRAGIGQSEPLNPERTLETTSAELYELTQAIGLNVPFVLVGHSRGALIARYFAHRYPTTVCGLVLIDPAIPELKWLKRQLRTAAEQPAFDAYYESFCSDSVRYSPTIRNEFKNTFYNDSAALAGIGFPATIPVTLIASTKPSKEKYSVAEVKLKTDLIEGYLKLHPKLKVVFTDKAGHFIHDEQPQLVTREIKLLITGLKSNSK